MKALTACLHLFAVLLCILWWRNPGKGLNWRKVIHFAFLVDEATLSGSSTSELMKLISRQWRLKSLKIKLIQYAHGISGLMVTQGYQGAETEKINSYIEVEIIHSNMLAVMCIYLPGLLFRISAFYTTHSQLCYTGFLTEWVSFA